VRVSTRLGPGQVAARVHLTFALVVPSIVGACAIGLLSGLFPALGAARGGIAAAAREHE
jgi:ABC-type antimicrobial peptide transport system permease subunit